MISTKSVIDRINEILYQQYPLFTFYIHSVPESVSRPSFNIYLEADRSEDNNCRLTNESVSVGIVYYAPVDGSIPDELKQLNVYDQIKDIFRKGHIKIDDRALKVVLIRGGRQDNEIFIIVKLVYTEDRPQDTTEVYTLIGEVNIK